MAPEHPLVRPPAPAPAPARSGGWRGLRRGLGGALAALGWLLVPKCPMCVAGYVALLTGASISLPAAAAIRLGLLAACAVSLAWCVFAAVRHRRRHRGTPGQTQPRAEPEMPAPAAARRLRANGSFRPR